MNTTDTTSSRSVCPILAQCAQDTPMHASPVTNSRTQTLDEAYDIASKHLGVQTPSPPFSFSLKPRATVATTGTAMALSASTFTSSASQELDPLTSLKQHLEQLLTQSKTTASTLQSAQGPQTAPDTTPPCTNCEAQATNTNTKLERMRTKLTKIKTKYAEMKIENTCLEQEKDSLEERVWKGSRDLVEAKRRLKDMKEQNECLAEQKLNLEKRIEEERIDADDDRQSQERLYMYYRDSQTEYHGEIHAALEQRIWGLEVEVAIFKGKEEDRLQEQLDEVRAVEIKDTFQAENESLWQQREEATELIETPPQGNDELKMEISCLREQLDEANRRIKTSVLKATLESQKKATQKYKEAAEKSNSALAALEQTMGGKTKTQARLRHLENENRNLMSKNVTIEAASNALKVELSLMTSWRDKAKDENVEIRREMAELDGQIDSMELTASQHEHTKRLLKETTEEAARAVILEEKLNLTKKPLEIMAGVHRRIFARGRSDEREVNALCNRDVHDPKFLVSVCLLLLGYITDADMVAMTPAYPPELFDEVTSYADVERLHSRGLAQELVDLRAAMIVEDPSTCVASIRQSFQDLDDKCKEKWEELSHRNPPLSEEQMFEAFGKDDDVRRMVVLMRGLRKRAGGRSRGRVAVVEDEVSTALTSRRASSSGGGW